MKTNAPVIANAVETILRAAANAEAPTFSETEIVRVVVEDFGNRGRLSGPLAAVASATNETQESVNLLRSFFRMELETIASGQISKGFRTKVFYEADRVVLVPRTNEAGVAFHIYPESLDAVIGFVLKLLIKGPYGADLKQCQLDKCGDFFFVSVRRQMSKKKQTGRSPDKYCTEEHMMAAHRASATAATMRRRKELKEQREAKRIASAKHKQEQKR